MATNEVSKTMRELLERMADSLDGAPTARLSGNDDPRETVSRRQTSTTSRLSSNPHHARNEEHLLSKVASLLDEKLQELEDRALKPMFNAISLLEGRFDRLETILSKRRDLDDNSGNHSVAKAVVPPNHTVPRRSTKSRPSLTSGSSRSARIDTELTGGEMELAVELIDRITQLGIRRPEALSKALDADGKQWNNGTNGTTSSWTCESSSASGSDEGKAVWETVNARPVASKRRYVSHEPALQDSDSDERIRDRSVIVEDDATAVRNLKPRPCHRFYLSKSGCSHPSCPFGHHYQLKKAHLKYLRQLAQSLPCIALKNGAVCRDGENGCIYRHKCPEGFHCHFGEKCRFFGIPDAHPYSGEFHTKKNYYDGKGLSGGKKYVEIEWEMETNGSPQAGTDGSGW